MTMDENVNYFFLTLCILSISKLARNRTMLYYTKYFLIKGHVLFKIHLKYNISMFYYCSQNLFSKSYILIIFLIFEKHSVVLPVQFYAVSSGFFAPPIFLFKFGLILKKRYYSQTKTVRIC